MVPLKVKAMAVQTADRRASLSVVAHPCKLPYLVFVTLLHNLETDFAAAVPKPLTGTQTCGAASSLYKLCRSCMSEPNSAAGNSPLELHCSSGEPSSKRFCPAKQLWQSLPNGQAAQPLPPQAPQLWPRRQMPGRCSHRLSQTSQHSCTCAAGSCWEAVMSRRLP